MLDVAYEKLAIKQAIKNQIGVTQVASSSIYGDGDAGNKIAAILATCELSFHKTITY